VGAAGAGRVSEVVQVVLMGPVDRVGVRRLAQLVARRSADRVDAGRLTGRWVEHRLVGRLDADR